MSQSSTVTNQPKILVTGGTGFAGSHLLEALREKGFTQLHATSSRNSKHFSSPLQDVTIHPVDLADREATFELIEKLKPDQVYHLASFSAVSNSFVHADTVLKNNISVQLNMLEAIRSFVPHAKMLSVGSAEVYGLREAASFHTPIAETTPLQPMSPYGISKVTQEMLAHMYSKSYDLHVIRVRPFNHIGERQTPTFAVPAFASQIVAIEQGKQKTLCVGNLEAIRDFTDVKDTVQAYILLMEKGNVSDVYNVGSGRGRQMKEVLEMLITLAEVPITVETDPSRMRPSDVPAIIADNTKITSLGWQPAIPLEETLQRILMDWRKHV